ncbi:PH domain-containing protein [Persicobacter psychrovividus]|uniref:Uncharacterized protein YyaB-like PH domain-containing protein n=1 Tax=Persicobacter psychrovividus TaxID=387638 RepID=A0ABM7VF68_9BACT|nr:hypothetical protein PEPS_18530 [Persicobacter psychrovividus]
MKKFSKKITKGDWFRLVLSVAYIALFFQEEGPWYFNVFISLFVIIALSQSFGIKYKVADGKLMVTMGPFKAKEVNLNDINALTVIENHAMFGGHHLEVKYNTYDTLKIYPSKEQDFIEALKGKNVSIAV